MWTAFIGKGCVYPPKSRAVATYEYREYSLAELCLPSKIENGYNFSLTLSLIAMVVFTLQNREQSQRSWKFSSIY